VAAVGRLRGLDVTTIQHAFGIAGSMASGSLQNFGTMTKPLHIGLAASNAMLASDLAAGGVTADPAELEGPLGFFAMYSDRTDLAAALTALRAEPSSLTRGLNNKRYPSCSATHFAAEALLEIVGQVDPEEIDEVEVIVEPTGLVPLMHHRPSTGTEARFSMEYVVAACLLDRRLDLESFTDVAVRRPAIRWMMDRVKAREAAVPPVGPCTWARHYAAVRIRTKDGATAANRVDVPHGQAADPLSDEELEAKARVCLLSCPRNVDARDVITGIRAMRHDRNSRALLATILG
jgi:2-methylcitrate dehydratase PrpD